MGSGASRYRARIEFTATRPAELRIEHWMTVRGWLGMLAEAVTGRSAEPLKELVAGVGSSTLDGLKNNPYSPRAGADADRLAEHFKGQTAGSVAAWSADHAREVGEIITGIREELSLRISAVTHPGTVIAGAMRWLELRPLIGSISEISILLQTRQGQGSNGRIIRFSGISQKLLDIVPFLSPDAERGTGYSRSLPRS